MIRTPEHEALLHEQLEYLLRQVNSRYNAAEIESIARAYNQLCCAAAVLTSPAVPER